MYKPLTSERRCFDFEIPLTIDINGKECVLPKCMLQKSVHFLITADGSVEKAAWIHQGLAHILNAKRLKGTEAEPSQWVKALKAIESEVGELVREKILRDRRGPGAMAFIQSNENVPPDKILISKRTYELLCKFHPQWRNAQSLLCVRFPNLGPRTTRRLGLVVNETSLDHLPETSIGYKLPELRQLMDELSEKRIAFTEGICDAFYINPKTLKDSFEGDGDGDQIFAVIEKIGRPLFTEIDLTREPADSIDYEILETLYEKARRYSNLPLSEYLPPLFDDTPIGQATYAIRWLVYKNLRKFKDSDHPMHEAWESVAPKAIELVEFIMDLRKGEFPEEVIKSNLRTIKTLSNEIRMAQISGDWFARIVTSRKPAYLSEFISKFKTLQEFLDQITGQNYVKPKETKRD